MSPCLEVELAPSSSDETTRQTSSTTQNTKNNVFFAVRGGRTDDLSLLKGKLHNCGRAGISFKQVKKISQNRQMYATFPKSQKNTCTNFAFETH